MIRSAWGDSIPLFDISVGTALKHKSPPPHIYIRWRKHVGRSREYAANPYPFAATGARAAAVETNHRGLNEVYPRGGQIHVVGNDARLPQWLEIRVETTARPLIDHLIDLRAKMDAVLDERVFVHLDVALNDFGIEFADGVTVSRGSAYRFDFQAGVRREVPLDERAHLVLKVYSEIETGLRKAVRASFGDTRPEYR